MLVKIEVKINSIGSEKINQYMGQPIYWQDKAIVGVDLADMADATIYAIRNYKGSGGVWGDPNK